MRVDGRRARFALRCLDDHSEGTRCESIYRHLCASREVDIVLGPYSSELTAFAAPIAEDAGRLFINHAGAADDLYDRGYRLIVGLQTPASEYMSDFVHSFARLNLWNKRLALVMEPTLFAQAVAAGGEAAAQEPAVRDAGVSVSLRWEDPLDPDEVSTPLVTSLRRKRINALASAGSYTHDLTVMRTAIRLHTNIPVLCCVGAGLNRFSVELDEDAEGILGMSQWEPSFEAVPELGPDPREFAHRMRTKTRSGECDYVAAEAYAAGVLAAAALNNIGTCDQGRMREHFSVLRTGTLFGAFAIDPETGHQTAHRMFLVQWRKGRKILISRELPGGANSIELPSFWHRLMGRAQIPGRIDPGASLSPAHGAHVSGTR